MLPTQILSMQTCVFSFNVDTTDSKCDNYCMALWRHYKQRWLKIRLILDPFFITSLIQMTDVVGCQMNHVIYLLQSWGETCCCWTCCWEVGAGALVWPWAPSISSPRTSGAVSRKHRHQDQPQGSLSHVLLDIEWQLDNI